MATAKLQQPPYDTSLMGVAHAALEHFGVACTKAEAFVVSGHAFVVNIHEELCPSGPYCWDQAPWRDLVQHLGLDVTPLGMLPPNAEATDKAVLEVAVREALDEEALCSLLNLDNQLVLGADDEGFLLAQPWGGKIESTPARLTFGSWAECRHGPPVAFFKLAPCTATFAEGVGPAAIFAALDFALALWGEPARYAERGYGLGERAYDNWLAALDAKAGDAHGNWWNGVVWGECREQAGDFFQRLAAAEFPGPIDQNVARQLAIDYRALARLLYRAADKTAPNAAKRQFVAEAKTLDTKCMAAIATLRE